MSKRCFLLVASLTLTLTGCSTGTTEYWSRMGHAPAPKSLHSAPPPKAPRIVTLHGKEAKAAIDGASRPGVYVDVMPNGTMVLYDKAIRPINLSAKISDLVSHGNMILTLRIAPNAPESSIEAVKNAAAQARVPVLEIVHIPLPNPYAGSEEPGGAEKAR